MDFPTISLDIGRTVVELSSEAAVRLRIAHGSMRRETLVTVYGADGSGRVMRAGDIPELAAAFLELSGPEPVEAADPPDALDESGLNNVPAASGNQQNTEPLAVARTEVSGIVAYARRRMLLFAEPSSSATPIGNLRRGDIAQVAVSTPAALDAAQGFVGLTSGGASLFGYAAALSATAPPSLVQTVDDEPATLARRLVALAEPAELMSSGRPLERGAPVLIAGRLADGRYEVLAADGRIAYLPADAFEPETMQTAPAAAPPPKPAPLPAANTTSAAAPAATLPSRSEPPARRAPTVPLLVIGGVVVGLILLVALIPHGGGAVAPATVSLYALRGVDVRSSPATGDNVVADQAKGPQRGAVITGTWTTSANGQTWLAVTDGIFKGDYIWGRNLSQSAPPTLTSQVTGPRALTADAGVYATPEGGQQAIQTLRQGYVVEVVGEDGQWAEILLKRGGVGYISASTIGA